MLIGRASGEPLDAFLRERVLVPLGMTSTRFATTHIDRLGSCYARNPETGERTVFDPPDGQWSTPPAFPSGAAGLVSTVDDVRVRPHAAAGGRLPDGPRLLSRASVEAMTTDHLGAGPDVPGPSPDGSQGWGLGSGSRCAGPGPRQRRQLRVGRWPRLVVGDDARERVAGVLLTTDMFTQPFPPPAIVQDFWTCVYASLGD